MKLGKLLAAGKSIMNGRTEVSYRSSRQIYLPKFGSPKNPFKTESPAQIEPRVSAVASATTQEVEKGSAIRARFSPPVKTASPVGKTETPMRSSGHESALTNLRIACPPAGAAQLVKPSAGYSNPPSTIPMAPVQAGPQSAAPRFTAPIKQKQDKDWSKFNPLSILRAALPAGKAARSDNMVKGQKGTATQTELSLDSVKVVHNDLSDVDVEVVPIKSRAVVADLPAPKNSWEYVGERLFGVEAT